MPAQAIINDGGGGGGGGGGGPIPAAITFDDQHGTTQTIDAAIGDKMYPWSASWEGSTFTGWWTAPAGGTLLPRPIVVTGNATYYAQWTLNSYTVTFQPANGAAPTTATADYETTISAPAQPARANYTFAGWFTSASGGTHVTFPYTVSGDATLYAHWTGAPRTVAFEPGNGDAAFVDSTEFGAILPAPAEPTRAHYSFVGWFTAAGGGTNVSFPYTVTTNATLYAQWTIDSHTVTFEPGNGEASSSTSADYGSSMAAPTQPSFIDHSFDGWFTAATGGTKVTFPYTVTGDTTLYGHWTSTLITLTVDAQNGTEPALFTHAEPFPEVLGEPSYPGHTFTGWWTAPVGGTPVANPISVSENITVYAQWTLDNHTVKFEPGNGEAFTTQTADYGTTVSKPADPTRAHYAFNGWFTAPSGGNQITFPYTVTGGVTLYAQWTIDTHTVTFEPGNGDDASSESEDHGTSIAEPAQPVLPNHHFQGWFTAPSGGTQVTFPYTLTGDVTLYGQWTIDTHNLTFAPGNGQGTWNIAEDYGNSVAAPTEPVFAHHEFNGWFTAPSGGTQVTFPYTLTGDVTLYAQWTIDTHTVTFEPGNGDNASAESAAYGSTTSAPAVPVLANYTFDGWFTAPRGGTQVTFPYTLTGDVTLYAQWTIDTHTVTLEPGNGDVATTESVAHGSTISPPAVPSRASHLFTGWFTAAEGGTLVTFPLIVTGDVTLYAQWERIPATFDAPDNVAPGATISVTGENFIPGESVEIWLLSTPTKLATVIVGADGTFETTVVIPAETSAGSHHLELRGTATETLSAPVEVTEVLAATGADIQFSVALAAFAVFGGLAMLAWRRWPA